LKREKITTSTEERRTRQISFSKTESVANSCFDQERRLTTKQFNVKQQLYSSTTVLQFNFFKKHSIDRSTQEMAGQSAACSGSGSTGSIKFFDPISIPDYGKKNFFNSMHGSN